MTHAQRQTFGWYLFSVYVQRERPEILVVAKYGFVVMEPRKFAFFTMENRIRFAMAPNMALSMDSDWAPPENMKDLIWTLV